MEPVDYANWKDAVIEEINAEPTAVSKGDRFVQRFLRDYYQLSEDDAVNATECAGPGDRGVDAIYVEEAEEGQPPTALTVQGKYGTAADGFSPYKEFSKFASALVDAQGGRAATKAIEQCASVLNHDGVITYVIATTEPLDNNLANEVDDLRALARQKFGEHITVQSASLLDVYEQITRAVFKGEGQVQLICDGVQPRPELFLGAATLIDVYYMLREYADGHNGIVDSIYDRNVRKWLGRAKSVNAGITKTLADDPDKFVAYNNGITLVCHKFTRADKHLMLTDPQIVNGCQTTRTLYEFIGNRFAGLTKQLRGLSDAAPYRAALLPFKLIGVERLDSQLVKNITRYSNKQNAVRGRDFLTLEEDFHRLKSELETSGFYLEVQTGEFQVLPKAEREKWRLINAFDALRFYGAGIYRKPHTVFGHSGDFTPGGPEFDAVMDGLRADDLRAPWLIAQDAAQLGYSIGTKWYDQGEDHRSQTRYFFLFVFFRIASDVLYDTPNVDMTARPRLYRDLDKLREARDSQEDSTFQDLLEIADGLIATYMALAKQENWFQDRNAFLKREDLLNEKNLLVAGAAVMLKKKQLALRAKKIVGT